MYNITGDEYDSRKDTLSNILLIELKNALGMFSGSTGSTNKSKSGASAYGYIVNELKPGLSSVAYKHVRIIILHILLNHISLFVIDIVSNCYSNCKYDY